MPANKNAVVRYKLLDVLLSDRYHYYDIHDLTEKVNDHLVDEGYEKVGQRTLEKDIEFLQDWPFSAPIEHVYENAKYIIRYEEPGFSIFRKELSNDERKLLAEVLNTLGQFSGLENFEWLESLRELIEAEETEPRKIISFSHNVDLEMMNSAILARLFTAISNKIVINLKYHTFQDPTIKEVIVHPYLLKQYNNRWFLFAAADKDGFILNFPLDRIDDFTPAIDKSYKKSPDDLEERFDSIIGVTLPSNATEEIILLWISDHDYPFIATKPIHYTQTLLVGEEDAELRKRYGFDDGKFVKISCVINYELKSLLCSFIDGVIALEPVSLHNELAHRLKTISLKYTNSRK